MAEKIHDDRTVENFLKYSTYRFKKSYKSKQDKSKETITRYFMVKPQKTKIREDFKSSPRRKNLTGNCSSGGKKSFPRVLNIWLKKKMISFPAKPFPSSRMLIKSRCLNEAIPEDSITEHLTRFDGMTE